MLRSCIFIAFVALATAEVTNFNYYKVYRVIPTSSEHLELLKQLGNIHDDYSYWSEPRHVFEAADLMVSPGQQDEFVKMMNLADMRYATYIEDVQQLIDQENGSPATADATGFGWTSYHTLDKIYEWLDSLGKAHPKEVKVVNAGKTYEGRIIKGVKLSFGNEERPGVFIEGGIHAREWISPATVTYLLDAFLTSKDPLVRKLAESYDWYIFPVFNPDGYVYTHTKNRLWRKTRSPSKNGLCYGVDANRNWDFKWMHGGASSDPCTETYAGSSGFSEIETKTMSEYINSIGDKLFAYISFHSYSQVFLFPYGHTSEHLDNYEENVEIGLKTVNALSKRYGTKYESGSVTEVMYVASGSSMDWAKGTLKLPLSYTFEVRDTGNHGFLLPAKQIIPNSEEILDSLFALFDTAAKFGYPKAQ